MKRRCVFALVIFTVLGCGDGDSALTHNRALTVGINAAPDDERGTVRLSAWVFNEGSSLSFVDGCTGSGLVSPIEFELVDPPGRLLSDAVEYPCGGPLLCPVTLRTLAAGVPDGYIERTLDFDGTLYVPDAMQPRDGCDQDLAREDRTGRCARVLLPPGRYTVVARFTYCTSTQSTASAHSDAVTFEF